MNKKSLIFVILVVVLSVFAANSIIAGTKVDDVIKMENKAYEKHTKPIINFTHKKHVEDYKVGCGECHHDDKGKPLTNLKMGDDVKNCIECHSKADYLKGKEARGKSDKELHEYHANALHDNCKECHKEYNKKNKLKSRDKGAAPTSCNQCHAK